MQLDGEGHRRDVQRGRQMKQGVQETRYLGLRAGIEVEQTGERQETV